MRCSKQKQTFTKISKEDRPGLLIEPAQVRLVYCWRYPHLRKFFKKNMNDQIVEAYKVLCQKVGVEKSIKAVARDALAELGEFSEGEVRG